MMKLHFEPNLDYQLQAIEAVCDLFRGQEICRTEFTVTMSAVGAAFLPSMESDLGVGNRLTLLDDELLANLQAVQLRNGLAPSATLASGDFTIEWGSSGEFVGADCRVSGLARRQGPVG
jgi:type III restriction enzyme